MKRRRAGITGVALVWLAAAACADDSDEIAKLIAGLADPSFPARERASGEILAHGRKQAEATERALAAAYRHSADPEIRFRSKSILLKLFMESTGYLGVHYGRRDLLNPQGEKHLGVSLTGIQEGSPAKNAGLLVGDVVLAIDGKVLDPLNLDRDFAIRIQSLGAGRAATLSVSRGGKAMDVKVTLAARTMPFAAAETEALFKERLQAVERKSAKD